jgi:hypothetical protein
MTGKQIEDLSEGAFSGVQASSSIMCKRLYVFSTRQ